ncbi:MAG: 1,4-alpha-glucan branching protein GlgB [Pseudomonadota bacterium]
MSERDALNQLAAGSHPDPFSILGAHDVDGVRCATYFAPGAARAAIVDEQGRQIRRARRIHDAGIYRAELLSQDPYRWRVHWPDGEVNDVQDPYGFGTSLGEVDLHLLGEGRHERIYEVLGANTMQCGGSRGTRFCVWAPNASRVSVIGDWNQWDGRRHPMRRHHAIGIWELFIPDIGDGARYKFELLDADGSLLPLKTDPFGNAFEAPPHNAAIVSTSDYQWCDHAWMNERVPQSLRKPQSVYEVHLGSWRRDEHNHWLDYRAIADTLIPYVSDMGFTHIELLPVTEHPFDGSWGYQPIGMFAPTYRFGSPDDFRYFVDTCHQAGIGVIVDWVPAHFPRDEHGLAQFDGTALYEHADPRKGAHADWGTLIFNYGRNEVVNYLIGSALYWIREFHIDALRVDAVASMLYLDYSREDGEWLPNEHGGNENLEAVAFIKRLNEAIHAAGAASYAEESTAWPGVSRPTYDGGLGFTFKWNMGWMNDSLQYIAEDPVHRRYHHDKLNFGLVYAFNENFVLPLSHDEVVHGKRSILGRMPGDHWQRFANLRAYLGFMYTHPGKKLMFMGTEFAQSAEWNHDQSLDWHLLEYAPHRAIQELVRDLNHLLRAQPALHDQDFDGAGFTWLDWKDSEHSVFAWLRNTADGQKVICICNMTPVVREGYRVGAPDWGAYSEILNTDHERYGGSNVVNGSKLETQPTAWHDQAQSLVVTLPPLATIVLKRA